MLQTVHTKLRQGSRKALMAVTALVIGVTPIVAFAPTAYAVAEPAPVSLAAYTGGNSIGLVWQPAAGSTPTGYNVYRNNTLIASNVAPDARFSPASVKAMRYIDTGVVGGTSYSYKVTALNSLAEESGFSNTATATHPTSPFPVPTVTISATPPADLVNYMNYSRTMLRDWYPKMATYLGSTSSTPTSFNIKSVSDGSFGGAAGYLGSTDTIGINEDFARSVINNSEGQSVWFHEATHVIQKGNVNVPSWVIEGEPGFIQEHMMRASVVSSMPPASTSYLSGYDKASYFLNWIRTNYSSTFAQDLHAAVKASSWDPNFFYNETKLTVGELWTQMTGNRVGSQMVFKNASGKCIQTANSAGAYPQLNTCSGGDAQNFTFVPDSYTGTVGSIKFRDNLCLDVQSSGTADGTPVWLVYCNTSAAQDWIIQSNGTLKNTNANKCLQPYMGNAANGTQMEIRSCGGYGSQLWGVRPHFLLQSTATASTLVNLCVGTASGANPSPGTSTAQNKSCTYGESQLLEYVQQSPGSNSGSYRIYGRSVCLEATGTADASLVVFAPCDNSDAQQWVRNPSMRLGNVWNDKCLQLQSASSANNTNLVTYTCNSVAAQKWAWATF